MMEQSLLNLGFRFEIAEAAALANFAQTVRFTQPLANSEGEVALPCFQQLM